MTSGVSPWQRLSRRPGWCAALAAVVVCGNTLANGFAYDDVPIILENPATSPQAEFFAPWGQRYWPWDSSFGPLVEHRPLVVQTYAIERRLFGAWPLPFHMLNVLLHAAVSAGVAWLARRVSGSAAVAALAGVLFAVHPVHAEAVANVVGRAELLAAGGLLLALWFHARGEDGGLPGRAHGKGAGQRPWLYGLGTVLAAGIAIYSKETGAAILPALVAWHLWLRLEARRAAGHPTARPAWRWGQLAGVLAGVLVLFGVYLAARHHVTHGRLVDVGPRTGLGNILPSGDGMERLLTPLAILGHYVGLMVWPARLLADYSVNVFPLVGSLAHPGVLLGLATIVVAVAGSLSSLRGRRTVLLCWIGALLSYLPIGNVLLRIEVICAERLFYAPSLWLCVLLALGLERLWQRLGASPGKSSIVAWRPATLARARRALAWGGGIALGALALRTIVRNPAWKDTQTLFENDLAAMTPGRRSVVLCMQLGQFYLAQGRQQEGEALLLEARDHAPDSPVLKRSALALRDLAEQALEAGRTEEAIQTLEHASRTSPDNRRVRRMLAALKRAREQGLEPRSELTAARAAAEASGDLEAVRRWATLAGELDVSDELPAYRRWLALEPENHQVRTVLADVLDRRGTAEEAVAAYLELLERQPDDYKAHANLAVLLCERGGLLEPEERAIFHARRAVELRPRDRRLRANLADVLARFGHAAEAAALFEQLARDEPEGSEQRRGFESRAARLRTP
jgi:tetratricopeptide (TPR) repeat protein